MCDLRVDGSLEDRPGEICFKSSYFNLWMESRFEGLQMDSLDDNSVREGAIILRGDRK